MSTQKRREQARLHSSLKKKKKHTEKEANQSISYVSIQEPVVVSSSV